MARQRVEVKPAITIQAVQSCRRFIDGVRQGIETGVPELRGSRARLVRLAACIIVFLGALALHWGLGAAFLLGLLAASAGGLVDGRFAVGVGLVDLACCPILLIVDQHAWLQQSPYVSYYLATVGIYTLTDVTNTLITWAFYLLCIGLVGLIVGYAGKDKRVDQLNHPSKKRDNQSLLKLHRKSKAARPK